MYEFTRGSQQPHEEARPVAGLRGSVRTQKASNSGAGIQVQGARPRTALLPPPHSPTWPLPSGWGLEGRQAAGRSALAHRQPGLMKTRHSCSVRELPQLVPCPHKGGSRLSERPAASQWFSHQQGRSICQPPKHAFKSIPSSSQKRL